MSDPATRADDGDLGRRLLAEGVGTAFLLLGVIGSGIMAERLSPDDVGLQLLENAFATAGILVALILALGPASGAHFNPAVTLADRLLGGMTTREATGYVVVQLLGGAVGVVVANVIFELDAVVVSTTDRSSPQLWLSELVATFGLVLVILGVVRSGSGRAAAFAVGGYIAGAYFFTSSTSFANPAVSVTRTLSDTFAGIAPGGVLPFVVAQLVGAAAAVVVGRTIYPDLPDVADDVVVPHGSPARR